MRKMTLIFLLLALSMPMYARKVPRSQMTVGNAAALTVTAVDDALPARLLAQVKARGMAHRASHAKGVHASVITDSVSARAFIIPAAGSLAAGGGALFFRSDVTLANYRSTPQQVLVGFWAQGTTNPINNSANYKTVTLPPGQFVTVQDFVATSLNTSGLGTLLFIPYTGTDFDENGAIDGFSRIYTNQPGSTGTVSQPFDAVDPDTLSAQYIDEAVALGMRQDANFRTNFGIVNVDAADHIFKISFVGEKLQTTLTVTVKAYGMIQQAIPAGDYGAVSILFQVTDAGNNFVSWIGYASSTDNLTGDGWVSLASADMSPSELDLIGY
ncbi:MAG: hypothetical protein WB973_15870 [Thermoanaerobaculia bacterium]